GTSRQPGRRGQPPPGGPPACLLPPSTRQPVEIPTAPRRESRLPFRRREGKPTIPIDLRGVGRDRAATTTPHSSRRRSQPAARRARDGTVVRTTARSFPG